MAEGKENQEKQPQTPPFQLNWSNLLWFFVFWLLLSLFFRSMAPPPSSDLPYTEFKELAGRQRIQEVVIQGNRITGVLETADSTDAEGPMAEAGRRSFTSRVPDFADPGLLPLLEENRVKVTVRSAEQSTFVTIMVSLLPWVLIIGFFIYFNRKLRERFGGDGMGGGPFGFGKSKAKRYSKSKTDVTMADVAGLDNAKKELEEIIAFLKEPGKFQKLGGKLPRGLLLAGPPGSGKTLLARATAGEAAVPFFSISGSEFIEMFVGVGAARVRDMFANAKKDAPSIIFIDEIDAVGRVRGTGLGGGHDEREQTLNQILSEMDGFSHHEAVVIMAATNRPDVLDPALVRPGRFDRQIYLDAPMKEARAKILGIHTRKMPLADDVNLDDVARRTVGFSGADLENLANEAALLAARENKDKIGDQEFDRAIDKVMLGLEREELINENDRKIVAYHEAGHALMAMLLPGADPLKKVSIIPRARALGATQQLPGEDRHNWSRTDLLNRLGILMGGRVAEKIVFNDITTGGADDLKKATDLARRMISRLGMSEQFGPAIFPPGEEHPFLGREITQERNFSDHTAQQIDNEIVKLVKEMEGKAHDLLSAGRDKLEAVAEALLERETLSGAEVEEILAKVEKAGKKRGGGRRKKKTEVGE